MSRFPELSTPDSPLWIPSAAQARERTVPAGPRHGRGPMTPPAGSSQVPHTHGRIRSSNPQVERECNRDGDTRHDPNHLP